MAEKKKDLELYFGVLYPNLSVQIKKQGYKFKKSNMADFESKRMSIYDLYFGNIINDTLKTKLQKKLMIKIVSHLKVMNK